jgi:hypothetical protein
LNFEVGDIVANSFGHVLAVGKVEGSFVFCFYQTNPSAGYARYKEEDLRLLSKTKEVEVGGDIFMKTIQTCLQRARFVERRVKEPKVVDEDEKALKKLSKTELRILLAKVKKEKALKIEESSPKSEKT